MNTRPGSPMMAWEPTRAIAFTKATRAPTPSEIQVARDGEWVSGLSVLSLLSLAAGQGTRLRVRAVGEDAEEAVEQLGRLLEALGEPVA